MKTLFPVFKLDNQHKCREADEKEISTHRAKNNGVATYAGS